MPRIDPQELDDSIAEQNSKVIATAIALAKVKNDRLRLMKERNEIYLAERVEEEGADEL